MYLCVVFCFFFITKSVHSEYIIIEHTCIINFFFFSFHFTVIELKMKYVRVKPEEEEICVG